MEITEVSRDVFAAIGPKGSANAGFIIGNDAVIVIDTMMSPKLTQGLLDAIKQRTSKPIRFLINTHYHGDHIAGNSFFADMTIIAHTATRKAMLERGENLITAMFSNRPELQQQFKEMKMALPTLIYDTKLTMYPGNMTVEIIHTGTGHTPADTIIYIPERRVLFASDLIFFKNFPMIFPEGSVQGWIAALESLIKMPADVVITGHGPLATTDDLRIFQTFLKDLQKQIVSCFNKGLSEEAALKQVIDSNRKNDWLFPERLSMCVSAIYGEQKSR